MAALVPSEEKAYFLKYLLLLNDGGKMVFLQQCESLSQNGLISELSKHRSTLKKLLPKILSRNQFGLLYPAVGSPDTSAFDISLLYVLLHNIFNIQEPSSQPPPSTDTSVEADVYRLRMARNAIAHPSKTEMTKTEFLTKWQELKQVLLRLGSGISDLQSKIDKFEKDTIDPAREEELFKELEQWKKIDEDLLKEVSKLTRDVADMKISQEKMKEDIKHLNDGKETEENTMTFIHNTTKRLSTEVTDLNTKVKKMKITDENVEQLQKDVSNLTENQTRLEADVSKVQKVVEERSKMSPELRHLASCTKMELEDAKNDTTYVKTEQHHKAKDIFTKHKLLILSGHPGEGKTTMARQLACEISSIDKCLELRYPEDWSLIDLDSNWFETLIIDDIFGAGALDESLAKKWERCIPSINKAPEKRLLNIIITTRHYIFKGAETVLRKLPIFKEVCVLTLSSAELSEPEMSQMLKAKLDKSKRNYEPLMIVKCIRMTRSTKLSPYLFEDKDFVFGYPQCVKMFVDSDDLFDNGPEYFKKPKEFFKHCIEEMYRDRERFLPLILVWSKKGQTLTESELDRSGQSGELKDIAESFKAEWNFNTLLKVRKSLEHFSGLFLEYDSRKGSYQFNHHVVEDMVGIVLSKDCPMAVLKYASRDFLLNYITVDAEKKDSSYHFFVQEYLYPSLAKQMFALFQTPSSHYLYYHSDGFHGTGRCPNKVTERSNIDVGLITSNIFKNKRLVEKFVEHLRRSEAKELLSTPVICLEGYFLGYGIRSKKIAIFLPEYFMQNGVPLVIEEMLRSRLSWGNGDVPELDIALLIAAHKGLIDTVQVLLKSGAKVTEELVYIAAVSKHTDVLTLIMKTGYEPGRHLQNFSIINGNNALIASAKRGLKESAEILIKYRVNVKYRNEKGLSALDKAALSDQPEICKLLLDKGAEVDTKSGNFKRTPLHTACDKGNIKVVKVLLQYNPKTDIKDHRGHYAIHCAAFQGHTEVVQTLLQYNKELARQRVISYGNKSKIKGMTVYHIAIWKDNLDMLVMLLENGADHSMADLFGRSPLFYAAQRGKIRLVKALMSISSHNDRDKQGLTPLHTALVWGHLEVAKLLLPFTDVNLRDKKGRTPLHLACHLGFTDVVKSMVLQHHADVRIETREGRTVFDIVMKNKDLLKFFRTVDPYMYEGFARRINH